MSSIYNFVKFVRGTPEQWEKSKSNHSPDTIYFIAEKESALGKLYIGDTLIANGEEASTINISEIQDILISSGLVNNSILVYDSSQSKWINKPISTLVDIMTGASDTEDGIAGLVPIPQIQDKILFLRGDATWADPTEEITKLLNSLINDDNNKSIREIAQEEVNKLVDGVSDDKNTLAKLENYYSSSLQWGNF